MTYQNKDNFFYRFFLKKLGIIRFTKKIIVGQKRLGRIPMINLSEENLYKTLKIYKNLLSRLIPSNPLINRI